MKDEIKTAIRNRGESHKALFWECFMQYTDAVKEGREEREQALRKVLLEAFDSAADDVTNLSIRIGDMQDEQTSQSD
jgi:hypothetical protein